MATNTDTKKVPFSVKGLPGGTVVDSGAAADRLAEKVIGPIALTYATAAGNTNAAYFVQNTTKKHRIGPLGIYGRLMRAYISGDTAPAGGALTWWFVGYDASANAEVVLTDSTATNPESITAREAQAQTLAATNANLDPDDTLELHCAADNNAVTQDAVGLSVTLVFNPTAETGNVATKTTYS